MNDVMLIRQIFTSPHSLITRHGYQSDPLKYDVNVWHKIWTKTQTISIIWILLMH